MQVAGADGRFGRAFEWLGVERAWTRTRGDPGLVIAVLDAGLPPDHPWAAGIIAARESVAEGIAGIAPLVRVLPVTFGDGSDAHAPDLSHAVEHAVETGASIIHIPASTDSTTACVTRAIQYAAARNVLVVCAASPSIAAMRARAGDDPAPNQITVLSVNERGEAHPAHADAMADIAAPSFARVPRAEGHEELVDATVGGAYVSGCAALVKSQNPGWGYLELKEHLRVSGTPLPSLGNRVEAGRVLDIANAVLGPIEIDAPASGLQWSAFTDATLRWRLRYRSAFCLNTVALYRRHGDEHWRELGYARASTGQMSIPASVMRRSDGILRIACRESNFYSDEVTLSIR